MKSMTKMISLVRTLCVTAIVSLLTQSVWAAVPVAVWDGNFPANNTEDQGVTLTYNTGNTLETDAETGKNYIVIGNTSGVGVTFIRSTTLGNTTVLVKYSSYSPSAATTLFTICANNKGNPNRVGICHDATGKIQGMYSSGNFDSTNATSGGSGMFAGTVDTAVTVGYRYSDPGIAYFEGSTEQFRRSGYKFGSDLTSRTVNGFTLGGAMNSGLSNHGAASDMKIHAVAVFDAELSSSDIAAYRWPSETVVYTGTVSGGNVSWDKTLPASPTAQDYLVFTGSGDAPVPANYASFGQITIGEGVNLTGVAPADISNVKFEGAGAIVVNSNATITVPSGITVKARGDIAVTLTNNGTFDVESGTCNVSRGSAQSVKGVVNIAKNATYVSKNDDSVPYNDGSVTINVRGTLDLGTTRWTVGSSDVINCYGGCTVTAASTNNRALDLFRDGTIINVIKVDGESTNVSLPALSPRKTNSTINIASGMTVSLEKPIAKSDTNNGLINITGGGKLSGTVSLKGVTINLGSTNSQVAKFVAVSDTNTIKLEGNDQNSVASDSKDAPFITVNSGATLNLAYNNFAGWYGDLDNGYVVNNGTLKITNLSNSSGFFRNHLIIGNGVTTELNNIHSSMIIYGGAATEETAQIQLASGSATIASTVDNAKGISLSNDYNGGGFGTKGAGVTVGTDAVLTISTLFKGSEALTKYGAGKLVLSNTSNTYSGSVNLKAGTIQSATALTVATDVSGMMVVGDGSEATPYALATIVAKIGTTPYASIEAAVAALTGEQTPLDITLVGDSVTALPAGCEDYKIVNGQIVAKVYVAQVGETKFESITDAMAVDGAIKIIGTPETSVALTKDITLDVATDLELTTVFSGAHSITKIGAGKLTLNADNTFTGGLIVNEGTVKETANKHGLGGFSGSPDCDNTPVVTVGTNGALDASGIATGNTDYCYQVVLSGTLTNSGNAISEDWRQLSKITIASNTAKITGNTFCLVHSSYNPTKLVFGEGSLLTVELASDTTEFKLRNTTISGEGTIKVMKGYMTLLSGTSIASNANVSFVLEGTGKVSDATKNLNADLITTTDDAKKVVTTEESYAYIYSVADKVNYTVTIGEHANATITEIPSSVREDAEAITFTVTLATGYNLTAVKANGTVLTAGENGVYTIKIAANTEITIETIKIEITEEEVTATTEKIQVGIPEGADSIVIESVDVEIAADATAIPFETGVYTIKAKKGETVVATETLGVIAAKTETGSETIAVAVPFTGATVANLLNTALLSKDDTLTAYISGKYEKWTLGEDKTWSYTKIVRGGGEEGEDLPATTALARGTAVWVTTAGKIVVLGKYNESAAIVAPTAKETHLLANPKMEEYTPEVNPTDPEDQVLEIGTAAPVRYTKKGGKWTKKAKIWDADWGMYIDGDEEVAPVIPVGKGFWFIKK